MFIAYQTFIESSDKEALAKERENAQIEYA